MTQSAGERAENRKVRESTGGKVHPPDRRSLMGIIGGLMMAENLGDVKDELDLLVEYVGIHPLEGSYEEGWTNADLHRFGLERDDA